MVLVTLHVTVPPHATSHVVDVFESYRGPVSARAGCRSVRLYCDSSTPGDFILLEEWSSPQALHGHIRSEDFRKVLALMDLAVRAPDLRFQRVSSTKGFDLVKELRQEGVDAVSEG